MIEHVSLHCGSVQRSRTFYKEALAPLGYRVKYDYPDSVGFMAEGHTSFWVSQDKRAEPMHLAFRARSRRAVDAFFRAAMKAGAKDNGGPGLRADYSPTYYAAFVLDPDGHNIEAVTFAKPRAKRKIRRRKQ